MDEWSIEHSGVNAHTAACFGRHSLFGLLCVLNVSTTSVIALQSIGQGCVTC